MDNPYAPPRAALETPLAGEARQDAERVRRSHLKHEASVRAVGTLYLLNGVMLGVLALVMFGMAITIITSGEGAGEAGLSVLIGIGYGLLAALTFWIGRGLRRLDPGIKLAATLLTCLSLLSIPVGTVIGAYILWLLHSRKGARVFAPDYRDIVAATPDIVYRTSPLVIGLVVLLVLAALLGVLFVVAA